MKLYGNIKSDRATKGQGGNEFLDIDVLNNDQEVVVKMKVKPGKDGKINVSLWNDPNKTDLDIATGDCNCSDPVCAKCLLRNCVDDRCTVHPLAKKLEFRELYKKRELL